MKQLRPLIVGLWLIFLAGILVELLFFESRQDPSLRIAALTIVGNLIVGILAIASTLMIGKDVTHPQEPAPPGTKSSTTIVQETPPDPPIDASKP